MTNKRRFDLDWLRICAIFAVFVFHSGRFFDTDFWHVKNPTTYFVMQVWTTILGSWLMPLIFVISGASLFYSLGSKKGRGVLKFVDDKVRRLFVPLLVGVFTSSILMVYLERITHDQFAGSFFDFIPHYFDGFYGAGGNFAWMGLHLWYLLVLFVYSLLFYPLFLWLGAGIGRRALNAFCGVLALPGAFYLLALPICYLIVALDPRTDIGQRNFGGWPLPAYIFFLLYGFIIVSHDGLQTRVRQFRWVSLAAAVGGIAVLFVLWARMGDPAFGTDRFLQVFGILGFSSWCWVLAWLGFGFKHFSQCKPILAYLTEAVLPFYIMHQTVLLSVGYFVTRWPIPDALKWLIIALCSLAIVMFAYEYVVRRYNLMRFLFGMKPLPRAVSPLPAAIQAE